MDQTSILKRLDILESKDAIRELITAYGLSNDEHDIPRLTALFTEDAEFTSPNSNMVAIGRQAIEDMYVATFRTRGPSFHWTHDVTITMDTHEADLASGLVLSHAETCPDGVVSIAAMRYIDDYRREPDGIWRFARREISFLYYSPVTDYQAVLNRTDRVTRGGTTHPADWPEGLPAWQAFDNQYGDEHD